MLEPLLPVRLTERAGRLQRGFAHRVPQLLEEHPEEEQHEGQESEEYPHIQRQVPAPAQSQGQRGGRHQEPLGGRHGVRQHPPLPPLSGTLSFPSLGSSQGLQMVCRCFRSHCFNDYPAGLAVIEFLCASMVLILTSGTRACPPWQANLLRAVARSLSCPFPWNEMVKILLQLCCASPLPCQTIRTKPASQFMRERKRKGGSMRGSGGWEMPSKITGCLHFTGEKSSHWSGNLFCSHLGTKKATSPCLFWIFLCWRNGVFNKSFPF